jgi:hypothetical protein
MSLSYKTHGRHLPLFIGVLRSISLGGCEPRLKMREGIGLANHFPCQRDAFAKTENAFALNAFGTGAWRLIGAVRTLRRDQLMRSDCGLAIVMLRLAISM